MTNWQPIETIPTDGTFVIVWNGSEMAILNKPGTCALGRWSRHKGQWYGAIQCFGSPTHWAPCPLPPSVD